MAENPELQVTRTFDVQKETLFQLWTDANHLKHWWTPTGYSIDVVKFELHQEGQFHYNQTSPEGHTMWGKFVYKEIEMPDRLVYISSFSDPDGQTCRAPFHPNWPLEILNTLNFIDEDGKTVLAMRGMPVSATEEELSIFQNAREGIQQGLAGTFNQLDTYIKQLKS
jgi:uncharacterized protein YndB with AHSA1/START domain